MSLETEIKDVINKKLNDGTIEKLVAEQLEKGINNALDSLFRSYGDVTKMIEEKVKSVMIPYLESFDYSDYIVKLDHVLKEVLKNSASEHKFMLENFKELMLPVENKELKVTDLFEKWTDYVARQVETDGLEIEYHDEPYYEDVITRMEVESNESRNWSIIEHAVVVFECEHDESLNFAIPISRWKESRDEGWDIDYKRVYDLSSLRYLNEFDILLMKLTQNNVKLIIDSHFEECEVTPKEQPEMTFY